MNNLRIEQVMWLCTTSIPCVGIVKCFDTIEQQHKYYIGLGPTGNEEADIKHIISWGQKFYSLDFLRDF